MSRVTLIYDELETRIAALVPDHELLSNPYELLDNSDIILEKAWGLAIATGTNTARSNCDLTQLREYVITLVEVVPIGNRDNDGRKIVEKSLLDTQLTIIKNLESNPKTDSSSKIDYTSDNGIELFFTERMLYFVLNTTINVEYFEQL